LIDGDLSRGSSPGPGPRRFGIFGAIERGEVALRLGVDTRGRARYASLVLAAVPLLNLVIAVAYGAGGCGCWSINRAYEAASPIDIPGVLTSGLGLFRAGLRILPTPRRTPGTCHSTIVGRLNREPVLPDGLVLIRAPRPSTRWFAPTPSSGTRAPAAGAYTTIALGRGARAFFAVFCFSTYLPLQQAVRACRPSPPDWRSAADRRSGGHSTTVADPRDPTHRG